jgi:hypothetical protein
MRQSTDHKQNLESFVGSSFEDNLEAIMITYSTHYSRSFLEYNASDNRTPNEVREPGVGAKVATQLW